MHNFEKELERLNSAQKEAVETIEGPVMVVAGPGTGKTQVLTLRIANILDKTDIEPENILAITFTESGVASMKKRLADLIGPAGYQVNITTFHSFANSVIHDHADQFPHIIGSRNISELEQVQLLEEILEEGSFQQLKPYGDPFYYLKKILSQINSLKREGVSSQELLRLSQEEKKLLLEQEDLYHEKGAHKGKMKGIYKEGLKYIERNLELVSIYENYAQTLKARKLYDYSDMINELLEALEKNEDLLFELQERFQYLLVDEHQDTNNAQNRILEKLMAFHKNPNIFVVGDEKQAIFRFQGASLENFLYFQKLYPSATLINLEANYRSSQTILDAAHSVKKSELSPETKLKAQKLIPLKELELVRASSPDMEMYFVASAIAKKLKQGSEPSEIAVLYRDNRDALDAAHMLEKLGVEFVIESDQNIFEDEEIKKLLALLRAVHHFGNQELLVELMHADFLKIEAFDMYKLLQYVKKQKKKLFDGMRNKLLLETMELESSEAILDLYRKLEDWKRKAHFKSLPALFEEIVRESGFLAHILALPDSAEKLEKLNSLFDEVKSLSAGHKDYSLKDFVEHLELLKNHDLLLKKAARPKVNKVRLMTAHKSKGLEFDSVYMIKLFDGHWGNKRKREYFKLPAKAFSLLGLDSVSSEEDERNLFYVALTRAKKEIILSYALENADGKEQLESQFISEIDKKYVKELDLSSVEEEFKKEQGILFKENVSQGPSLSEKEFLKDLFLERGLSVTALNNYLRCPWEYFFKILIRLPQAKTKPLMYGTAVHTALQETLEKVRAGEEATKSFLLASFKLALEKETLTKSEYEELLEKGRVALSSYFDEHAKSWSKNVLNELDLKKVPFETGKVEIHLTGKIDKLEFLDAEQKKVKVVDYKTGKPKSENYILGNTKNSSGDMYRQLVFYKMLLDRYKEGKYEMKIGEIDFVEPDEKGRHKSFAFEILENQVKDLEKEVARVSQEILNLDFWKKSCEQKDCEYCELSGRIGTEY